MDSDRPPHHTTPDALSLGSEIDRLFVDVSTGCPYGLEHLAVYHQAVLTGVPDLIMARFLAAGYRRNGNCLYRMVCPDCRSCVPIRMRPSEFRPNRNQRRVLKKNRDVETGIHAFSMSRENIALLDKFLGHRFPDHRNSAESYYSGFFLGAVTRGFEIRYRVKERLIGVAIVNLGVSWLNGVYFFFDPDEAERSPGTFNILHLIDFCRRNGIDLFYLGYWIEEVGAMRYKSAFRPHELLIDGRWQERALP